MSLGISGYQSSTLRDYFTLLKPGEYQISQIDAPAVPRAEAASAARWKIQEMIDYPLGNATVDAVFIPTASGAETRHAQMLVVSARNETIAATIQPFNEADIALEAVDIPELAQRNFARWLQLGCDSLQR